MTGLLVNITTTMDIPLMTTMIWMGMGLWTAPMISMTELVKILAVVREVPVEMLE